MPRKCSFHSAKSNRGQAKFGAKWTPTITVNVTLEGHELFVVQHQLADADVVQEAKNIIKEALHEDLAIRDFKRCQNISDAV